MNANAYFSTLDLAMIIVFDCASLINENMSVVPLHLGFSVITSHMAILS